MQVRRMVVLTAACGVLLAGCGGGGGGGGDGDTKPDTSTAPTTAVDDGTTPPGTELSLGAPAVVHYDNAALKASQVKLTVTGVKKGKIKDLSQFTLNPAAKSSSVYYVRLNVANTGPGNLGGKSVTLYGKVSDSLVVPPVTFGSTFAPCNYKALPKKFTKGAKTKVCMVMLAPKHGTISAIEWRGAGDPEPISWAVR